MESELKNLKIGSVTGREKGEENSNDKGLREGCSQFEITGMQRKFLGDKSRTSHIKMID